MSPQSSGSLMTTNASLSIPDCSTYRAEFLYGWKSPDTTPRNGPPSVGNSRFKVSKKCMQSTRRPEPKARDHQREYQHSQQAVSSAKRFDCSTGSCVAGVLAVLLCRCAVEGTRYWTTAVNTVLDRQCHSSTVSIIKQALSTHRSGPVIGSVATLILSLRKFRLKITFSLGFLNNLCNCFLFYVLNTWMSLVRSMT